MLFNETKNTLITDDILFCKSHFSKATGLMFSPQKNLIFIFDKEVKEPLHMFFVFYPIDVLFLDANKTIVEIKRNLKPFTVYNPKKKAQYIIELSLQYNAVYALGDCLEF